jgi:hypothetical protein
MSLWEADNGCDSCRFRHHTPIPGLSGSRSNRRHGRSCGHAVSLHVARDRIRLCPDPDGWGSSLSGPGTRRLRTSGRLQCLPQRRGRDSRVQAAAMAGTQVSNFEQFSRRLLRYPGACRLPRTPPPKCAEAMREMASIAPVSAGDRGGAVFACGPCNQTKWIDVDISLYAGRR